MDQDSGASKHIILNTTIFDTYDVSASWNMHLDGNSVVKAMNMGSIIVKHSSKIISTKYVSNMHSTCSNCIPVCS